MSSWLRKSYYRIPSYGQLMTSKGIRASGWYKPESQETYFSLMLKGKGRGLFRSGRFYLVLTEKGLDEAIERGKKNIKYANPAIAFGAYNGIERIVTEPINNLPAHVFDCVSLHVYKYVHGGRVEDYVLILSERQFRRAIARAKNHPELVVRRKITDRLVTVLYKILRFGKK